MRINRHRTAFLFVLLLAGYADPFAGNHEYSFGSLSLRPIQFKNSVEFDRNGNQDILFQYAAISENDDDDDLEPGGKKALFSRCSAMHTICSPANHSSSSRVNRRLYKHHRYLSNDKYIFQRVLRV